MIDASILLRYVRIGVLTEVLRERRSGSLLRSGALRARRLECLEDDGGFNLEAVATIGVRER